MIPLTAAWPLALVLGAPEEAPPPTPEPAPEADTADGPREVVVRVDPLQEEPEEEEKVVPPPEPEPVPQTDHYGIASRSSTKEDFGKRPDPPKPVPSEEAAARDTDVQLDEKGKRKAKRPGTPQHFEFEFKMGPYLPNVDRLYTGSGLGPYAMIFGRTNDAGAAIDQPRAGVMPAVAFEWQIVYLAGPLGIGTQIGFFRDKAKALLVEPMDDGSVRSAADDTSFGMVPLALQAVYRFELLADKFRVPLVPYAKGGLAYAFWWTRDGSGKISRNSQGQKGSGGVPGWQVNVGGMLRLDFIEPNTAKTFDKLTGINHTYIFGEYQLSRIANFGAGNAIALGDSTWFAGLAIEF